MRFVTAAPVVVVGKCDSSPFKKLETYTVGLWKSWVHRILAGRPFSTRDFSEQKVLGRVDADNPTDKLEPTTERDAATDDLRLAGLTQMKPVFKNWRFVVLESTQETFSDSVVAGRATALTVCRKMLQKGRDPKRWFAEWAKELSTGRKDRASHEMHSLIDIFYQAKGASRHRSEDIFTLLYLQ